MCWLDVMVLDTVTGVCLWIFVIISGVKLKYLSSPSVGLTHSIMSALFWQELKLVNVWAGARETNIDPGEEEEERNCCGTTISSLLYLSRFQVIITDILFVHLHQHGSLSRLVTLLGRENKLISSKVVIDAELRREEGREGGGGGFGICLILNCKICGT